MRVISVSAAFKWLALLFFFVFVFFSPVSALAEPPYEPLWTQQLGSAADDYAEGVAVDSSGNAYVAGYTSGDLGGPSAGGLDLFLVKYAPDGTRLWTSQRGSAASDRAQGVAVDSSGNAYVAGYTEGGPVVFSDLLLVKYASDGTWLWTQQLGSAGEDRAEGVAVDSSGNAYVAGYTSGDLGGPSAGGLDLFLVKYAPDGTRLWTKQYGSLGSDWAYGVAVDSSGNAYVTGYTSGDLAGPVAGLSDLFLIKYAPDGTRLWTKQLGSAAEERAWGVAVDSSGNAYVTGVTSGDLGGPWAGSWDLFLVKYAPDGARLWETKLGSADIDNGRDVAVDSSGNVYVAGSRGGAVEYDIILVKYAPDGARLWTKQLSTPSREDGRGVAVDSSGNAYVTGYTEGDIGGPSAGGWDILVIKFGPPTSPLESYVSLNGIALVADPSTSKGLGYLTDGEAAPFKKGDIFSFAPVQLPHGVKIKKLKCVVRDNTDKGYIQVNLLRGPINTTDTSIPPQGIASAVTFPATISPNFQDISGDPASDLSEVDNTRYGYFFRVDFLDSPGRVNGKTTLSVRGCVIAFEMQD